MDSTKYLIIGGGLAAARAVEELVKADESAKGATVMLTGENDLPYHRPPLSKGYFLGSETRDDIYVNPAEFFSENGIDVQFRRKARLIDPASLTAELELNASIKFEKALIATGASPVRFDGPGRSLGGLHYLRTVQDSDRLRGAAEQINELVIVGSSFIGMELASGFVQKGVRTTVLSRGHQPWAALNNPDASDFFMGYFQKQGVRFVMDDEPAGFVGVGAVNKVETVKGARIACDGVVLGIGVRPNTAVAKASRMEVDDGVVVDECLQTGIAGVYAAGDVASFPDSVFGTRRRIEHWDNAEKQGQTAGRNLAGGQEPYEAVSMFFSDVFDLSLELWGRAEDAERVIHRGSVSKNSIFSWYISGDKVQGALLMGRPPEEGEIVEKLIRQRTSVTNKYDILRNEDRSLEDLL